MDNSQQANIGPTRSTSEKAGPVQRRPPFISPSEFAELFGGTFRSNAVAMVRVRQPHLDHTKMDDVELLFWGRYYGAYDGTLHDWLALMKSKFKTGNITDNQAMEKLREHAKTILDQSIPIIGRPPISADEDIHYASIPNATFAIRVWGTGMEASHTYNLDFVDRDTLQHIRPPLSCQLYTIHSPDKWWLPHFRCGKVEMAPGSEMYQVFEGDSFMLSVDTDTRVLFDIPVRPIHVKPDWLLGATTVVFKRSVT